MTVREAAPRGATHPSGSPAPTPPRGGALRAFQTAAALALVALAGLVSATSGVGCSNPPFCEGGFVRKAPSGDDPGICEGKCTAAACGDGQACVDNHCALTCTSHLDCTPLAQDCAPAKDDDNKDILTCQGNGKGSIGVKCPFGNECMTQFSCPDGKVCDPACTGSSCPCAADQCKPLSCITSGQGDAEAFCTLQDCHADADCPGGWWCDPVRDPHKICNSQVGSNLFCNASTDPCVDPSMDMANGTTYQAGTQCALRNQCRVRHQCAACETDLDCSGEPGQHCTMMPKDGTKACTRDCAVDADCEVGFQCTTGACVPRYGSCVGGGTFCEPCRTDLECGPNFLCVSFGGSEHMCIDATLATSCTTDADCPTSPSGLHGYCGQTSGDATYHKCFAPPVNTGSGRASCWCSNPGTACFKASECCSNKCVGASAANQIPGTCK